MAARAELQHRAAAWTKFFIGFPATHAVTLAYNPCFGGTNSWCYRVLDDGELDRLPTSRVPIWPGDNRLPIIRRIRLEQVHSDLDRLDRDVDRKLLGRHFNELPAAQRSAFVGFIEHRDTNLHVHLLWRVPEGRGDEFADQIAERWKADSRFKSADVKPIRDEGWASYVLKHQVGSALNGDPALFVANRARKHP